MSRAFLNEAEAEAIAALFAPVRKRIADLLAGDPDRIGLVEATEVAMIDKRIETRIEMIREGLHRTHVEGEE